MSRGLHRLENDGARVPRGCVAMASASHPCAGERRRRSERQKRSQRARGRGEGELEGGGGGSPSWSEHSSGRGERQGETGQLSTTPTAHRRRGAGERNHVLQNWSSSLSLLSLVQRNINNGALHICSLNVQRGSSPVATLWMNNTHVHGGR